MKTTSTGLALGLAVAMNTATAALIPLAGGTMVYDNVKNITWLADANYAKTSGYTMTLPINDNDLGYMFWDQAVTWARDLVYGGYDDWRLPTTEQSDPSCDYQHAGSGGGPVSEGYGCTGSEMGYLFYVNLGGVAGERLSDTHNGNYDLFANIEAGNYWSGTANPYAGIDASYTFHFDGGFAGRQVGSHSVEQGFLAWAVRSGGEPRDIPLPNTLWLISVALGAWSALRYRNAEYRS